MSKQTALQPRVYPIGPPLTEEQTAVAFAMTSRSPEPFDEIAQRVSQTRAAEFHERWVLGYGHASVAEHAVVHMAIENVSRLAADAVESNRLASYTEKSSRYQPMSAGAFHTPAELDERPALADQYRASMERLFQYYQEAVGVLSEQLIHTLPRQDDETEDQHRRRCRRACLDSARAVLPAATLTNLGMSANARTMAHAISKLLSDELEEMHVLGESIRTQATEIVPTLLKHADPNDMVRRNRAVPSPPEPGAHELRAVILMNWDHDAARRVAWGLQYPGRPDAAGPSPQQDEAAAASAVSQQLAGRAEHDPLPRALELTRYTLEMVLDYGALRELRRHRMMTPISQPLRVINGWNLPPLFLDAGRQDILLDAVEEAEQLYDALAGISAALAQYTVLHAHRQRILLDLNLRQLVEILRLRTSERAHPSIRQPCLKLEAEIRNVQPELMDAVLGPATALRE